MRIIILWGVLLCSLCTYAQTAVADSDSIVRTKDPYYLQLFGGFNKSANENLPFSEFTRYPWSMGVFFAVGREFSPLWGWRVALRFNHNKSRNVQECESHKVYGWYNVALFGDLTFDVTDVFRPKPDAERWKSDDPESRDYNKEGNKRYKETSSIPRFNLKAFAGVGLAYAWDYTNVPLSYTHEYSRASKVVPALRAGLTATYRIKRNWRVGAEISQNLFGDRFNGVAYDFPIDGRTNMKVGLAYLFLPKEKKPAPPVIRRIKLKQCPPLPLVMPDPEDTKLRYVSGHAFLDFPVNETIIYPQYRKNPEELARIKKMVDSVLFDKSVTITGISLHGYASPESPYSNNTRLAKGRTESFKSYLMRKYAFNSRLFTTTYTPEDWENLRGFLMNSEGRKVKDNFWYDNLAYVETPEVPDIVRDNCNELISIIDKNMDADAKEELLKKVAGGQPYQWLLEHVYPGLRHTDYIIEYEVKPYPVAKGRRLIYTHPEAMSLEEMYKVAQSYEEGTDDWLDALLIAVQQYPDSEVANFNAACGCVKTKRLNDARKYLEKAGKNNDVRYVGNVIRAMEGSVNWELKNGRLVVYEDI